MKIYLDVSCLNRPFDDQGQTRIRLEAEAVNLILEKADTGRWTLVSSQMAQIEIAATPNEERRHRVMVLLPPLDDIIELTPQHFERAKALEELGFKAADAVHAAAAESLGADVLLTCDDRFIRAGARNRMEQRVRIMNPLAWLAEIDNAPDA